MVIKRHARFSNGEPNLTPKHGRPGGSSLPGQSVGRDAPLARPLGFRTLMVVLLFSVIPAAIHAQSAQSARPMISPVGVAPGPSGWMFGQAYGNTTGAYNFGDLWYSAGQGLHFGIDLSMPCETPLVATADGVVVGVDDLNFGSAPHNLLIRHDALGLVTLYGHLYDRPPLTVGQSVRQGDFVGYSGDPDETCISRPHLHLEVRSLNYRTTYNPLDLIDANWHSLALIGPYSFPLFAADLNNVRRWVWINDQPDVQFGGQRLNRYSAAYPESNGRVPIPATAPGRVAPPLTADSRYTLRQITTDGCCAIVQWHPFEAETLLTVDGIPGSRAGWFQRDVRTPDLITPMGDAPPPYLSADGAFTIQAEGNDQTRITRMSDGALAVIPTGERLGMLSPLSTSLMWTVSNGASVPGATRPTTGIYVMNMADGVQREIYRAAGVDARWLDDTRVLITRTEQRVMTLTLMYLDSGAQLELGAWRQLRGLTVSPGGKRIMFYLSFQDDPAQNGVYMLNLLDDSAARIERMEWFGAWRWRDEDSVYYIPYRPEVATHQLWAHSFTDGTSRLLLDETGGTFAVANGHWVVSADGARVAFQNVFDGNLWVLDPLFTDANAES